MTEIKMPPAGQTTDEAVIAKINVKIGDIVKRGDVLLEAETDKAVLPIESYASGKVLAIPVSEGTSVTKGTVLVVLGKDGEVWQAGSAAPSSAPAAPEEIQKPAAEEKKPEAKAVPPAMPNAKAAAKERGIDLSRIVPSNGEYIKKKDVLAYTEPVKEEPQEETDDYRPIIKGQKPPIPPAGTNEISFASEESYTVLEMDRIRRTIGLRMLLSAHTIPAWNCTVTVNTEACSALRVAFKEQGIALSLNDIIAKAAAAAARSFPLINARYEGGEIRIYEHTNIGLAVATNDGNLVVPTVKQIDQKGLEAIHTEYTALIQKARENKLRPDEMGCGSLTISNLGMYGIDHFTAIVNPPESCILAVGSIQTNPVWNSSEFVPVPQMTVTGSFDHRMIDGAYGARFMKELKSLLEHPALMLR